MDDIDRYLTRTIYAVYAELKKRPDYTLSQVLADLQRLQIMVSDLRAERDTISRTRKPLPEQVGAGEIAEHAPCMRA